jgi:hypothetical protein
MDFLRGISHTMKEAQSRGSSQAMEQVEEVLGQSRGQVREALQELTAAAMEDIIGKLENNQPLTPEEQCHVRWWLVGEAEGRSRLEQVFQDQCAEFQRLTETVGQYESQEASIKELLNLEGILADAARVAADLRQFLEDKERIARFEDAMRNLDRDGSLFVARMLREKLASPEI